jgi:uncharacterized protein (DUF885 family)
MTNRRELMTGAAAAGAMALAPSLGHATVPAGDKRLASVFDRMADGYLSFHPEAATNLGLDKGKRATAKHRLDGRSAAAIAADAAFCDAYASELSKIPDAALSPAAQISRATIRYACMLGHEARPFDFGFNNLTAAMSESQSPHVVDQQNGALHGIPEMLDSQHQVKTVDDAIAYVDRLHVFARVLDEETERMKADDARDIRPPNFLLTNAIGQGADFLKTKVPDQRLVTAFKAKLAAANLPAKIAEEAEHVVGAEVMLAANRQQEQLQALLAKSDDRAGVWRLKDGEAYYRWCLKVGTTTDMTPDQVHQMGLEQNKAIEARMDTLLKAQGLTHGTVGERMSALTRDPRFAFPNTQAGRDQIVAYLNGRIAAARADLPKVSNLHLKAPVVVRPVPVDIQDGAGLGYMNSGSLDGSRPSIYYINLKDTANWPKFTLPSLTYHETLPGHAWQGAYLTETGKTPLIRILLSGFNAYVEGWALYAEQMGDEIGLYDDDPFGRLGYLQAMKFRAVRLVVDTGIHAQRWTRDQAIDWAVQNAGRTRGAMTSEIDRYCGWPGQACGYKVGHTEIVRLRDKAKAAMGARYTLQGFNDAVVEAGSVPLTVLATAVDRYAGSILKR